MGAAGGPGTGQACANCYAASKTPHPGVFDGPACLQNYTQHLPKLAHPQEAFVQCWCFHKSWGGNTCGDVPTTGSGSSCLPALERLCGGARRSSGGNCLAAAHAHAAQLIQQAGCTSDDFDWFCGGA